MYLMEQDIKVNTVNRAGSNSDAIIWGGAGRPWLLMDKEMGISRGISTLLGDR